MRVCESLGRGPAAARVPRNAQAAALWTCVCFLGLALNNLILFVDKVITPEVDLPLWRNLPALQ